MTTKKLTLDLRIDPDVDFREQLLERLRTIRGALIEDVTLMAFLEDEPHAEDLGRYLIMGSDHEEVMYALGYLYGAHSAMRITIGEMFDNEGIDTSNLETVQ